MVRTPSRDNSGLRKGAWTPEEDQRLIAYVTSYGCWNWSRLPTFAGLDRSGNSCRLRWVNYLRPDIKRGNFTQEEEKIIIRLHAAIGNRWSVIAAQLPGRTDNEIKNHWHATLKKRFQRNAVANEEAEASKSKDNESRWTPEKVLGRRDNETTDGWHSQFLQSNVMAASDELNSEPTQYTELERPRGKVVSADFNQRPWYISPSFSSSQTESSMYWSREEESVASWSTFSCGS